jgi:hypothetical protein
MIVDYGLTNNDGVMDIEFSFVDSLPNNIYLSIENSGIDKIEKLNPANLALIKNLVDNSLKWITANKRCEKIDVVIEKASDERVNIFTYCLKNNETIKYDYFYNF